jgi:hypothetical protein
VRVRQGQRLLVQVEASGGAPFLLFVDVFRATGDSARPLARVASADSGRGTLEAVAREDGEFSSGCSPSCCVGGATP